MPAVAAPTPIPSPWGGVNTRDGISALNPQDARSLVNWDIDGQSVKPRKGTALHDTTDESGSTLGTLAAYLGDTNFYLLGVAGGKIYDCTSATGTLLYNGSYSDNRFQTECYNNYMIGVNGTDTPWAYTGSAIAATGFSGSGLTLTNLVNVRKVRDRLWFCEKNSANAWYGAVQAVTGTLTEFQLSQVTSGGYLMAVGAHSQDAGAGPDDYTVFVMSTGEVVVYSGDPSTTFSKVGNYWMPAPVGRQCLVNIGGPLAVLTRMGLVPIQSAVAGLAFDMLAIGNYGKAGPSIKADIDSYIAQTGFHVVFFEGKVICNIPTSATTAKQWVYNSLTGAWTSHAGRNTRCFAIHSNDLYFGGVADGKVYKVSGTLDLGNAIAVSSRGAYVIPSNGRKISATAIKFSMQIEGTLTGGYGLDQDFIDRPITLTAIQIAASTTDTPWGAAWGSDWATTTKVPGQYFSVYGEGQSLALAMEASAAVTSLDWQGAHVKVRTLLS